MRANYRVNAGSQFRLLSEDECQEVYLAALRVLQHTGIAIRSELAIDLLERHGAWVERSCAHIPSSMVEQARSRAPASFTLYGREEDGSWNLEISPNRVHYGPSITATHFLDPRTGERRRYFRDDAVAVARVCDALPHIDYVAAQGTISDVHPDLVEVYEFATLISNSRKPVMAWSNTLDGCRDVHRIAAVVAGGEEQLSRYPTYFFLGCPISPLTVPGEVAEQLIYCAQNTIPYVFGPCPMCGATTPCTLASTLVVATAECLAALVIAQLVNPGTPFIMGGSLTTMDMRTASMPYGAPELSLLCAAETEIARYLGLPAWSTAGVSDSKQVDEQAALEGALNVMIASLSGADLIHNVGFIEGCLTGSLQYLVMMDEAIGYAKRILRGIEVTPETLALDWIDEIGPGGSFLSTEHTLAHFRSEFWYPTIIDRQMREAWNSSGRKGLSVRVQEKLDEILDRHDVAPLAAELNSEVEHILAVAEERVSSVQK
jgi:trimethylamine--corrinoid protein Co-methyltransferase